MTQVSMTVSDRGEESPSILCVKMHYFNSKSPCYFTKSKPLNIKPIIIQCIRKKVVTICTIILNAPYFRDTSIWKKVWNFLYILLTLPLTCKPTLSQFLGSVWIHCSRSEHAYIPLFLLGLKPLSGKSFKRRGKAI